MFQGIRNGADAMEGTTFDRAKNSASTTPGAAANSGRDPTTGLGTYPFAAYAAVDRRRAMAFARTLVDSPDELLLVLDEQQCYIAASRSFLATFAIERPEPTGVPLHLIGQGAWDHADLHDLLDASWRREMATCLPSAALEMNAPPFGGRQRRIRLNACAFGFGAGGPRLFLVAAQDVTAWRRAEDILLDQIQCRAADRLAISTVVGLDGPDAGPQRPQTPS
jgi:PAS domain-containing protein